MINHVSSHLNRCVLKPLTFFLFLISSALVTPVHAAVIDLFFAGGQSNASQYWADGLESVLTANYDNALVVYQNHPGNRMEEWYDEYARRNYNDDIYKDSVTEPGLLQSTIDGIIANGDTYRFQGFFWYQGAGEYTSETRVSLYEERFMSMLGQVQTDLGLDPFRYMLAVVEADRTGWGTGKTADFEALRAVQFETGTNPLGMSYDIATGGYTFVDQWHLSDASAEQAGVDMANAFVSAVPVPAAVWLFGSGLIGLIGVARRK